MLSRMVLKSLASMVPVRVRSVTVWSSVVVKAEDNVPAVTFSVLLVWPFTIKLIIRQNITQTVLVILQV